MDKSKWMPWLVAGGLFFLASLIYFFPEIQGKKAQQHDAISYTAAAKEVKDFRSENGEEPLWTGRMFSGMPTYFISFVSPANLFAHANKLFKLFVGGAIGTFFILMFGFYLLLRVMGVNHWLSIAGGLIYGFSSYFVILVQAGHYTKLLAIAYAAPVLAGIVLTYRKNLWLGLAITGLFTCMEIYANHIQITYYLFMAIVVFGISEAIRFISRGELKSFLIKTAFIVAAALIGVSPNFTKLWTVYDAAQDTIRGGKSELTPITEKGKKEKKSDGLTKDYAYAWSYGIGETMTLAFPHARGGASKESLDEESHVYSALRKAGVDRRMAKDFVEGGMPTYWGSQPFTSGPTFIGIVSFVLIFLGFFVLKKEEMMQLAVGFAVLLILHFLRSKDYIAIWLYFTMAISLAIWLIYYFSSRQKDFAWISIVVVLFIMLSWGKNMQWFSDIFFENLPMYNKFRAPSMALVMAEFFVPLLAILSLSSIIKHKEMFSDKRFYAGTGIVAGICLIVAVMPHFFFNMSPAFEDGGTIQEIIETRVVGGAKEFSYAITDADKGLMQQLMQGGFPENSAKNIIIALQEDRVDMLSSDGWTALGFVIVIAAIVYFWKQNSINIQTLGILLAVVGCFELVRIDTNYLSHDNYVAQRKYKDNFDESPADRMIAQDPGYFRVLNLSVSTFNDATTSYHHHSVGGYSAAKLQLYQDLIERHISKNNQKVWSMLNTKYIIQDPRQPNRFNNLGPLWNVQNIKWVENADEEMASLDSFEPSEDMIIDQRYKSTYTDWNFNYDSTASINFVQYEPNHMTYQTKADQAQMVVFSEIFYRGNEDWKSYIDGKEYPHFRCNYVLRGMLIPAGNHKVEFKFEPRTFRIGERVSFAGSLSLLALVIFGVFRFVKEQKNQR